MQIVFDIGGTNMRVAAFDGKGIGSVKISATPSDPQEGMKSLVALMHEISRSERIEGAIGGVAGTFEPSGAIFRSPHLPSWQGLDLAATLRERLSAPVRTVNDAQLAALGEAVYGAGRGTRIMAYVGVGTGLGGARIVDGKADANACGFEPGQMIIFDGKTLESQVAGAGLASEYGKACFDLPASVFEERAPLLAAGLYNIMMLWSPDLLVMGGSLMNETSGYRLGRIREEFAKLPTVFSRPPELRVSELGNMNGLWGAVAYASDISER